MRILITVLLAITFSVSETTTQWEQISTIGNYELRGVIFFDEYTGLVCGDGGIWLSTNSGMNWTQVWTIDYMNSFSFLNSSIGLASGNNGKVLKTTNGGLNWAYTTTSISENLYAVDWANSSICWAVGQAGKILKSVNGGNNWYEQFNPMSDDLRGVYMNDASFGFICGGNSREQVLRTVNGGNNWLNILNVTGNYTNGMFALNYSQVIICGTNGRIRKTTNTGTNWILVPSGTSVHLNSIQFADLSTGYSAGNNGTIIKSTNAGVNWFSQQTNTTRNLYCISFLNPLTGWAVGQNGIVLRTGITVGMQSNENRSPSEFVLFQNYPNPFNPKTIITYELRATSYVQLAVYNIEGKELIKLVNLVSKAGRYQIEFDGSNLGSGLYFYKLITKNFSETKKMLMIK